MGEQHKKHNRRAKAPPYIPCKDCFFCNYGAYNRRNTYYHKQVEHIGADYIA